MFDFLKSLSGHKEKGKKRREIVVDISELAPIWLKYNQTFTILKPEKEVEVQAEGGLPGEGKKKETVPDFFGQEVVREFYDPYRQVFESQKAHEGYFKLLEFLDRYGVCPSIVTIGEDSEGDELYSVSRILEKITLRQHSINVAREMLKLIKETYRDYEDLIPEALIISFGHDIGKAPVLRESGIYVKADHPILSEMKLRELFKGVEPHWFEHALRIVKEHHGHTKEPLGQLFITADSRAREKEIASFSSEFNLKPWDEWFDVKRFLEIILPEINVLKTQNKWDAFSFGSYVYLKPDLVYESARKLGDEKKIVDMLLLKISNKQEAIKKAVESLRKAGLLSPDLEDGKWARWYEIKGQWINLKMLLIPVKIGGFGILPHVLEERKEGLLEKIEKISLTEKY